MKMTVATAEAQKSFYPTPPALAQRLVEGLPMNHTMHILEPSAGTGNLIFALAPQIYSYYYSRSCYGNMTLNVDCCEIDPALRSILKDNFSKEARERCQEAQKAILEAEGCDKYDIYKLSDDSIVVYDQLDQTETLMEKATVRIVHDNFLSFNPEMHYDAIIMNPPFADGDRHLLKAL